MSDLSTLLPRGIDRSARLCAPACQLSHVAHSLRDKATPCRFVGRKLAPILAGRFLGVTPIPTAAQALQVVEVPRVAALVYRGSMVHL